MPDVLISGTHIWDNLSQQEKKWLQEVVDRPVIYQRSLWADAEKEALEEVQKAGVTIIRPNKSLFEENVQSVYDQYKNDKDMPDLIQRIKNTN